MNHPDVKITDLTGQDNWMLSGASVKLDIEHSPQTQALEAQVNALLQSQRDRSKHIFLLEWQGNKIPRDAEILGKKIAWTQNGTVVVDGGKNIGTYERLVEFGGNSRNEQMMVIFTND